MQFIKTIEELESESSDTIKKIDLDLDLVLDQVFHLTQAIDLGLLNIDLVGAVFF